MSATSSNNDQERDSIARFTNQSRNNIQNNNNNNNIYSSMDDSGANKFAGLSKLGSKKDHRKFDKDRPKPYLDENEFCAAMEEWLDGERPAIVDDIILHLTGVELTQVK